MRIAKIIICLIICLSVSSLNVKANELNCTEKKLYVNQSFKLKLKGTSNGIKYKSTNKRIATVSKSGLVKGKKVGKVIIKAIKKGKIYKCNVIVKKYTLKAMEKRVNRYLKNHYKYFFVASDFDSPEKVDGNYRYWVRSTGGTQANILVGNILVNPKNGKGVLSLDGQNSKQVNVLK